MKRYNVQALRGHEHDDHQFQQDMRDVGINIPDTLLYTKDSVSGILIPTSRMSC